MRFPKERRNKYGNRKVIWKGEEFDSEAEYGRYRELKWLATKGIVRELRRQVSYELIPALRDDHGQLCERSVHYVADFVYVDEDGSTVVEDVKGVKTKEYIIKRKLMLWRYGIRIREIKGYR